MTAYRLPGGDKTSHFDRAEFRDWAGKMAPELVRKLDRFRDQLGYPVQISPADGALGRHAGDSASRHNVDRWNAVQAVDVMPTPLDANGHPRGLTQPEIEHAVEVAKGVGFGGVGVYPHWLPYPGMHLDVRPMGSDGVDTWAGLPDHDSGGQRYVALNAGINQWQSAA